MDNKFLRWNTRGHFFPHATMQQFLIKQISIISLKNGKIHYICTRQLAGIIVIDKQQFSHKNVLKENLTLPKLERLTNRF